MKWVSGFALAILAFMVLPAALRAGTVSVDSYSAGSFYTCPTCNQSLNRLFVTVGSYIHGAYSFPLEGHGPIITEATLALRSSLLSTDNAKINVIGYDGGGATFVLDAPGGESIGVWNLYDRIESPRTFLFDVTDFVRETQSGAVGFRLEPISGFNTYAIPGRLIITSIPEPATLASLIGAISILPSLRQRNSNWRPDSTRRDCETRRIARESFVRCRLAPNAATQCGPEKTRTCQRMPAAVRHPAHESFAARVRRKLADPILPERLTHGYNCPLFVGHRSPRTHPAFGSPSLAS
jgi:hypothetical protein